MAEGLGTGQFFAIRYRRLWPAVAVGMALGLASGVEVTPFQTVLGFLMIPLFQLGWAFPLDGAIWSTSLELVLNVVHAGALAKVSNRALLFAVAASALATIPLLEPGHGLEGGPAGGAFGFAFLRGMIAYPFGIVLWRVWRDKPPLRIPALATLLALPLLLVVSALGHAPASADYLFVLLACPILIAGGLQTAPRWGPFLGAISFPLYAVHGPLLQIAADFHLPPWVGGAAALILVCAYVQLNAIAGRWSRVAIPRAA